MLLISLFLKGAAYFIIPVYFVLFSILAAFFLDLKTNKLMIVWTCLSIPLIYMFAPQLKMFPVGLGLKNLFIVLSFDFSFFTFTTNFFKLL